MIYLNNKLITPTKFPDGTSQVWKLQACFNQHGNQIIRWNFENDAELFHVCQLVDLIRRIIFHSTITLSMPFLPYGRQDKDVSNQNTFALSTFAKIINSLRLDEVQTIDAHSEKANSIKNLTNIFPADFIQNALNETKAVTLGFPDKGAFDRYADKFKHDVITGHKVRNQLNGFITNFVFEGDPKGKNILIVDDICDGGMTFIMMTKALIDAGAKTVHLYVTHGIFSKGLDVLRDAGITRIFTKDGEIK